MAQRQIKEAADIETTATEVRGVAARFLARWTDPMTINLVDDIAQVTTLDALACYDRLQDERCMPGFVRTIARRLRFKALRREHGRCDADSEPSVHEVVECAHDPVKLRVCSRWIARDQLLPWLDDALARLPALNSRLLREFYGGCSCRDLAVRHRLTMETVKVRLHRSRERVRANIERRAVSNLV